jgi:hypothetical protein
MANWARGLAAGLESGYKLGEVLRQKNERERMQEIMQAKPEQISQGYTAEDAAQLQAMSNARDPQGNPYYNVQSTGGLGYQVQPNFQTYEGGAYSPVEMRQPSAVTNFLGQRYGAAGPTAEQMDQARYRAMADVLAQTNPAEGLRMRREMAAEQRATAAENRAQGLYGGQLQSQEQQIELGGLNINAAKDVEQQREKLRKVDEGYSKWFKDRVGDKTPTSDDAIAGLQWRATELFKVGLGDDATKATQQQMVMANQRIELQTKERAAEIPKVLTALKAGNTKAVEDFYHNYIPDGVNVTNVKANKDGSYTISRKSLDGSKMPDTKIGSLAELSATIETFANPAALSNFTQREIENNFRSRTLSIQESEAKSNKDYRAETLGLRKRELEKPTAASIVPFQDKATGETVLVDITGLPRENGVIQTPKGLTAIKGRDTSISEKDKEIFEGVKKSAAWTRAKTADEKAAVIKINGLDPSKFGYEGRRNLYAEE